MAYARVGITIRNPQQHLELLTNVPSSYLHYHRGRVFVLEMLSAGANSNGYSWHVVRCPFCSKVYKRAGEAPRAVAGNWARR
jgi:hypothetical protein